MNLCQTLYCKTGKAPGPCLTGGNSVAGQGGVGIKSYNEKINTFFNYFLIKMVPRVT